MLSCLVLQSCAQAVSAIPDSAELDSRELIHTHIAALCVPPAAVAADVCSDEPCMNGGLCSRAPDMETGYMCSCPPPFVGSRCELESGPMTTTIPHPTPTASRSLFQMEPLLLVH